MIWIPLEPNSEARPNLCDEPVEIDLTLPRLQAQHSDPKGKNKGYVELLCKRWIWWTAYVWISESCFNISYLYIYIYIILYIYIIYIYDILSCSMISYLWLSRSTWSTRLNILHGIEKRSVRAQLQLIHDILSAPGRSFSPHGTALQDFPSGYVKIAIENGHRNSEFSH